MEPGFSHWFTVARPEAMAHTETQGVPSKHQETLFTGTGFPVGLWSFHPWRYLQEISPGWLALGGLS